MPFWVLDQPSPRPLHNSTPASGPLGLSHDPDISAQLYALSLGTHVPLAFTPDAPVKKHNELPPVLQQLSMLVLPPLVQPSQLLLQPTPSGPALTTGWQQPGLVAPLLASLQIAH